MNNLSFAYQQKIKITGILLMYPLYWGPDVPCNMLSYIFLCCDYIATLLVPQFLLLPTITCVQTYHVPKSPAEMQKSRLWTRITFFWLRFFIPNLTKILIYMYITPCRSLLLFWEVWKNSNLLRIPSSVECLKNNTCYMII